jgi:hypothetical protein
MSADGMLSELQFGLRQMKLNASPYDGGPEHSQHPAVEAAADAAQMNPVTLYRGTSDYSRRGVGDVASFTENRKVALNFAGQKRGSRVMRFKPGTLPALRVQDHLPAEDDQKEREWVARVPSPHANGEFNPDHFGRSAPGAP